MTKKDDIYIQVLKYAVENDGPFDLTKMFKELHVTEDQKVMLLQQVEIGNVLAHRMTTVGFNRRVESCEQIKVWCSAIDRFRLLEYQELQEARESSKSASRMARIAILISIISFFSAVGISLYQISSPIILPEHFWDRQDEFIKALETKVAESLNNQDS
ncbi:hypothetical protein AB4277_16545 [Vibrio splendidus]|uniref:Uncharacterized protein n=1 Tax=Vibrio kanaloae TaxID=170673 RepID=A0A4U1YXG2_9VIBR|nr:hypothetical protein [Vibrio kanaloae]TKF26304.1 hypothetical protein FCV50_21300 [Vibrio kanaloae]